MKYLKYVLVTLYVYLGLVTFLNTLQQQGSGNWHHNVFGNSNPIILDWWWVIIPSLLITAVLARYASANTQKILLWAFTGLVIFLIGGTYL
jgi:hypothetical protein